MIRKIKTDMDSTKKWAIENHGWLKYVPSWSVKLYRNGKKGHLQDKVKSE
jgi:hypothetical protein